MKGYILKIFIDEAGLFNPSTKKKSWSSIGALVVPDDLDDNDLEMVLIKFKEECSVNPHDEFKDRNAIKIKPLSNLLKSLKAMNCSLFISSVNGYKYNGSDISIHREKLIKAIHLYQEHTREGKEVDARIHELIEEIRNLSLQQLVQCKLQIYLIDAIFERMITYYAIHSPKSLGKFNWIIDSKEPGKEISYEKIFKQILPGTLIAASIRDPKPLVNFENADYSLFFKNFSNIPHERNSKNLESFPNVSDKRKGALLEYGIPFDFVNFLDDIQLHDSKESAGLQIVDLLVSTVNRTLKGNFEESSEIVSELSALLINSLRIDRNAIDAVLLTESSHYEEDEVSFLTSLNANATKLYSEILRLKASEGLKEFEI